MLETGIKGRAETVVTDKNNTQTTNNTVIKSEWAKSIPYSLK